MFRLILASGLLAFAFGSSPHHIEGKIVGGRNTTISEFPYQLSFEFNGQQHCGASLIRPNMAVTAAHCTAKLREYMDYMIIRAGTSYWGDGGQTATVADICTHPRYYDHDYDVSVLLLDTPFDLDSKTQLIALQPPNKDIRVGTFATVTGWGRVSDGGATSPQLQAVDVPKLTFSSCQAKYPKEHITPRQDCYGYKKGTKDACQGDSGGPLVVDGKLVGIVSWGYGCALPELPGVYVKVSDPSINKHINSCIDGFSANKK